MKTVRFALKKMDVGQTLDGKYHIERELGRGGMGTVYLATHLGTERPVAIKIIAPQFMERIEFVERFRREARAAGRLRHPNVVNVTDFGFSESHEGRIAYLVMEYLDGCTLGEILDEEKNLPVSWTLDILEQVCSAVHEAHGQGIIHRDLKPDNIWLEPNQRGGYTVKVLDFGIAKLEEAATGTSGEFPVFENALPTQHDSAKTTFSGSETDSTVVDAAAHTHFNDGATAARPAKQSTVLSEAGTIQLTPQGAVIDPRAATESKTAILSDGDISGDVAIPVESISNAPTTGRSLYDSNASGELTRVGAVLGTPLYMSPEQCRGEHLDPRSDIYSLGVIAYQMLSGRTPFEGDFKAVMEAHQHVEPAPLKAKRVRKKLRRGIHSALQKDPALRPQTAEAFTSELRARSEGIAGLVRRAMMIYSEHLTKFLALTGFLSIPIIVLSLLVLAVSFLKTSGEISETAGTVLMGTTGVVTAIVNAFCTSVIFGTIAWVVAQHLAVPLRPIRLRPALAEARKKWKCMAGTGFLTGILPFVAWAVGFIAGFIVFGIIGAVVYLVTGSFDSIPIIGGIGGVVVGFAVFLLAYILWVLVPPVVMMENVRTIEALRRSRHLVKRSFMTSMAAVGIIFLLPALFAGGLSYIVNISAKAFDPKPPPAIEKTVETTETTAAAQPEKDKEFGIKFDIGTQPKISEPPKEMDMREKVKRTALESLIQILWLPTQIFVFSFSGIIIALLYMKTRLAGGESMNDLIERFEDDGRPRKKWQERVRQRLIQSGRIPSKP